MARLFYAPSKNAVQKTLSAELLVGATASASLSDVDGIPNSPGIMVIDRVDANGTATPSKREYIAYSGTSGSTVVTLTRNVDGGGTDQTHAVGAVVEFVPDTTWAKSIQDAIATVVTAADTTAVNTTNIVTPTGTQTLTNKTLTTPNIALGVISASGATISTILDEDAMGSNSATALATQQSIKAYVDANGFSGSLADSDHTGGSSTSSSTFANITGADVSITLTATSNIMLVATVQAYANLGALTGSVDYSIQLHDGTSAVGGVVGTSLNVGNTRVVLSANHVISKAAGTHTFTIQHKSNNGLTSCTAEAINFSAIAIPS